MLSTKVKNAIGPIFPVLNKIRLAALRIKYAGSKVYCPCCGHSFSEFAPFGKNRRKNAWCPKCQSLERDRLLWMYLDKRTNLYTAPVRLLHIAPEIIFFHKFSSQKNIDYVPGDIHPQLYPSGTKHFDLLSNEAPENSFDAIICNHVFQYISDDKTAMQTVYNLMKPGGWGILQVPINGTRIDTYEDDSITDPIEREKAFGLTEHVRYYGLDYADKLRAFGFEVRVDNYSAAFSDEDIYRYGFWKNDPIYYVTKKLLQICIIIDLAIFP